MPDLSGHNAMVTGASDGVGVEIARALAAAGASLTLPVRNRPKGEAVAAMLRGEHPNAMIAVRDLDLASLTSVRTLARTLLEEDRPLHVLVLNAGIVLLGDPERHVSEDGNELHLQTNALGHAALVAGILPLLTAGAARIAVQCSLAARFGRIAWNDVQSERRYSALRAYSASKVALGLFATEFARRSDASGWGVRTVLCHPGVAMTNIAPPEFRDGSRWSTRLGRSLMDRGVFGQSAPDAALPALHAVTDSDLRNGDFAVPGGSGELRGPAVRRRLYRSLRDPHAAHRAWGVAQKLTGARFPQPEAAR